MKSNRLLPGWLLLGFLAASVSEAQFVRLSRCHAAYPCLIPFGLQYNPDPLIAGPYAQPPTTAVSGRIDLKFPLKVEIDRPIEQKAIDEALRKSIELHSGAKGEKTPATAPTAPASPLPAAESPGPKTPPNQP